ncbi:MAG TPA: hypothetical protein ENG80_06110 [Nitrospirae bacterium]|nr:hypothetical protein BMS3Abin10_00432 [bacterium BMS3Abin10]GBE39233.1 hypothetical protein BMS3Bbin08_01855 [bacterium BMS3Bbin08]HDH01364.1 hypothetical protein [Nitrospirota bacterium]HDH50113.1 hypothetical protein [Nitrospirota bacterium]HDK81621.1 hypothetical protein [Nitrospirota bacterium]
MLEEHEKIAMIAQNIHNAYEDNYSDKKIRSQFEALFDRFLAPVDPEATMEPYDVIIVLGRQNPKEFEQMLKEMKERSLIPGD